jgi:hypothetical protein
VAAVVITAWAAFGGTTPEIFLNLGPGDSAFIEGFTSNPEVEEKVGTHWTTYGATIQLPFTVDRANVEADVRFARVFAEEAVVQIGIGGVAAEPFRARGGEIRDLRLVTSGVSGPLRATIETDSHERRNMGIKLDRIRFRAVSDAPFRLTGTAAARPVVAILMLLGALIVLGNTSVTAGLIGLSAAVAFTALARVDLFQAWRQIYWAPELLAAATPVFAGMRWWARREGVDERTSSWLAAGSVVALVIRAAFAFHPAFYYPDLLTHGRVVEAIRAEGPAFFLDPAASLDAQKAWTKPVLGSTTSLPYAVGFHTPVALVASALTLSRDGIETCEKLFGVLVSCMPILLGGILAARLGLPPIAALALVVIPTYASRLSFALLPALFGHVLDLLVLICLIAAAQPKDERSRSQDLVVLVAALIAGHLAYTSSVVNEGVLVCAIACACLLSGRSGVMPAARIIGMEAIASVLALALYYRSFVGNLFDLPARILGGAGSAGASVYPVESFWALLFERTNTFFGLSFTVLAVAGFVAAGVAVTASRVVQGWFVAYLALIFLRAKIPDVFRYGHETLFVTPLVALLAGTAIVLLWRRGGPARAGAIMVAAGVVIVSAGEQWSAFASQLANAL